MRMNYHQVANNPSSASGATASGLKRPPGEKGRANSEKQPSDSSSGNIVGQPS